MKKIFLLLLLCMSNILCFSQNIWIQTNAFSFKIYENYNWSDWSDWIDTKVNIKLDFDNDIVTIYSSKKQVYRIVDFEKNKKDKFNTAQRSFKIIDQDNDLGIMRFRVDPYKNLQIYVEFADVKWVYLYIKKD